MNSKKNFNSVFDVLGIRVHENEFHRPDIQDIELALLELIYLAEKDLKSLGLLISWCKVHADSIIYEKLEKHYKIYSKIKGETIVYTIFMIFCSVYGKRRIKNRCKKLTSKSFFPSDKTTELMLKRSTPLEELKKYNIYMSEKSLRIREEDVLTVKQMISKNEQYKNRYIYGSSWRADIIYHINKGANSPFEISKLIGCSYEPANRVWHQYQLLS